MGSLPKPFPVETSFHSPEGPHPFSVSMGMGIQPPLLCFHGDPDPAPLRPARSPQTVSGFLKCSPGLRVLSRSGSSCQSLRGARFEVLGHPHTSWSCYGKLVSALPPKVPGQPTGDSYLSSRIQRNVFFWGCVSKVRAGSSQIRSLDLCLVTSSPSCHSG